MKRVSVITVNYNHSNVTEALLESIFKTNTYQPLEIIVVDNGSKINPVPAWTVKYPEVKFIRSDENLGFAGGNNLGIERATGDYLFFVNNDTEFTEGLVGLLADVLDKHTDVGMVSPKIRYYDQPDTLQYAGYTPMNYYTARNSCIGQFEKDNGQYDSLTGETGYIHGAAMMLRREVVEKVGGIPDIYFLYYEEMDWCELVRRAGYKIWVNMQALIYHKESVSVGGKSPLKEYFMNRNRILFVRRNSSPFGKSVFWPYFIMVVTPRNIAGYIKDKQWNYIGVLLRAIRWNMCNGVNSKNLGYTVK
jgi:GT2 family glycosyltransferase